MKGRKPKPAALRQLHGSKKRPYHDEPAPLPGDHDPVEHRSIPDPPRALVRSERRYWGYFAPLLAGARVLTPADVESLADYCRACVCVDDRSRRLRTAFAKKKLDTSLVRLLDSQLRGWVEKKTRLASELGLTAIARTRINWTGYPQRPKPTREDVPREAPKSTFAKLQEQAARLRRPVGVIAGK
jgi:phage terminase small subunit